MLSYVFWHWKQPSASPADYEDRLLAFHRALVEFPPRGFLRSWAFQISGAPWIAEAQVYEDWYLVEDFASLGELNEGAVTAARKLPHDLAAALAGGGTAGVYKLIAGDPAAAGFATWFSKPAGVPYGEFFDSLAGWSKASGSALWQRQMTLGPAGEFCLHSEHRAEPPVEWRPVSVSLRPLVGPLC